MATAGTLLVERTDYLLLQMKVRDPDRVRVSVLLKNLQMSIVVVKVKFIGLDYERVLGELETSHTHWERVRLPNVRLVAWASHDLKTTIH